MLLCFQNTENVHVFAGLIHFNGKHQAVSVICVTLLYITYEIQTKRAVELTGHQTKQCLSFIGFPRRLS